MPDRRSFLKTSIAASIASVSIASGMPLHSEVMAATPRKSRIQQSVSRWCYKDIPLDKLCAYAAEIGLKGIDLLELDEFEIPRRYGLICTMGYAGGGTIPDALNRVEHHDAIEMAFRKNIPIAAKAGVPNVITFSGNRRGLADDEGARNTITGLNRLKKIAEDNGVTICMELLNSKRDHHDYMADHTAWGARVVNEVNSPRIKLLYDIYHMQIMEGDLIATVTENIHTIGHFHTGGVPGRHEIDATQEIQYPPLMQAIAGLDYKGYVAHEFVPANDPLASLRQAVDLCDV